MGKVAVAGVSDLGNRIIYVLAILILRQREFLLFGKKSKKKGNVHDSAICH